jgi:hypothetical protein
MERKRRLPARAARVESASKKRTSTPPEQRNQTPPTPTAPPPAVEESLPKSIAAGKPLPTLDEPQPDNLSSKEFQSISERCAFFLACCHTQKNILTHVLLQWSSCRVTTTITSKMAQRGHLREILDEANEEEGRSRFDKQSCEGYDDEAWNLHYHRRTTHL